MARRALILCTSCDIGGMERLAVGITRQLSLRGWEVELVFGGGPGEGALLAWARGQGVCASAHPAVLSVLQPQHSWASVRDLATLISSRNPDVVNLHYGGAHISLKDVLAVRLARVPRCVVQLHLPVEWHTSGRKKRLATRVASMLVDAVIVHSRAVGRVVSEAGVAPRKVHVVKPGIALPAVSNAPGDLRASLGIASDSFVVGCMARLVEHKGVADLIAAIGRTDGCVLVVAGDGPDRERLEQLAAGAAPGRVHFLGMVSGDPAPFFAALDVFALPSHSEGFGLVLIEAAMRHVPVIGTRIGGIEDAVLEGETGMLVTMADSAEMACAINKLRSSPELRSRLAEAAFRRAMSEFTEQAMGEAEQAVLLGKSRSK